MNRFSVVIVTLTMRWSSSSSSSDRVDVWSTTDGLWWTTTNRQISQRWVMDGARSGLIRFISSAASLPSSCLDYTVHRLNNSNDITLFKLNRSSQKDHAALTSNTCHVILGSQSVKLWSSSATVTVKCYKRRLVLRYDTTP